MNFPGKFYEFPYLPSIFSRRTSPPIPGAPFRPRVIWLPPGQPSTFSAISIWEFHQEISDDFMAFDAEKWWFSKEIHQWEFQDPKMEVLSCTI
jgi:hypothetical protein